MLLLGDECIVGALSFIKADEVYEGRSLIVGNPAKKIKEVSDEMMQWKTEGTKLYQQLPADMFATFKECEPLRDVQLQKSTKSSNSYITWNERKRSDK